MLTMDHAITVSFPSSLKELTLSSADHLQKDVQSRMTCSTVYSPVKKLKLVERGVMMTQPNKISVELFSKYIFLWLTRVGTCWL